MPDKINLTQLVQNIINKVNFSESCRGLQAKEDATTIAKHYFEKEQINFDGWKISEIPLAEITEGFPAVLAICIYNQKDQVIGLCFDVNGNLLGTDYYNGKEEIPFDTIKQAIDFINMQGKKVLILIDDKNIKDNKTGVLYQILNENRYSDRKYHVIIDNMDFFLKENEFQFIEN